MNTAHDSVDAILDLRAGAELRRRSGGGWAKIQIIIGLIAAIWGLLIAEHQVRVFYPRPCPPEAIMWTFLGVILFALGGYLALAGHRSHVYRSILESEAKLMEAIHQARMLAAIRHDDSRDENRFKSSTVPS